MGLLKGFRNKGRAKRPPEQLKWENLTISSVGEEVEQLELLFIAVGMQTEAITLEICLNPMA